VFGELAIRRRGDGMHERLGTTEVTRRDTGRRSGWAHRLTPLGVTALLTVCIPLLAPAPAGASAAGASDVSVSLASTATNAPTDYLVKFVTLGNLEIEQDSFTLTFANGTNSSTLKNTAIVDTTSEVILGSCPGAVPGDTNSPTVTCSIDDGENASAGDSISVDLDGLTNPPSANSGDTVSVSVDSGPATASSTYAITPAQSVSDVMFASTNDGTGATANDTISFVTSSTGALSYNADETASLIFPDNTDLESISPATIWDTTTNTPLGQCDNTVNTLVTCSIADANAAAGNTITVTLDGTVNPSNASSGDTVSVETSVDNAAEVDSNPYDITAPNEVSSVAVTQAGSSATSAVSSYTVGFTASGVGGVGSGGSISVTFPTGTVLTEAAMVATDTTTGQALTSSALSCQTSSTTLTCTTSNPINARGHGVGAARRRHQSVQPKRG
jgi:hypothetical protein